MILLLDHDDSFVYTLARYVTELGQAAVVVRASATTAAEVAARRPKRIILSPGPCSPRECPVAVDVVRQLGSTVPILGVCLGHQCIGAAYGGSVRRVRPRHGMTSPVTHDGRGVFAGVPSPVVVTRYHALALDPGTLPSQLIATATSTDGVIMGVRHRTHPVEGVQFHPESILTEWGYRMLGNFLGIATPESSRLADSPSALLNRQTISPGAAPSG